MRSGQDFGKELGGFLVLRGKAVLLFLSPVPIHAGWLLVRLPLDPLLSQASF
jgi:hypothetical protein